MNKNVPYITIKFIINENIFRIIIDKKINELLNDELLELYSIIEAFRRKEKKKGNEYDNCTLKISYIKDMVITEYINIFKMVRVPIIYDFLSYFRKIDRIFEEQSTDTTINMNDYLRSIENVKQEINIKMIYNISSKLEEILKESDNIIKVIKVTQIDEVLFEEINGKKI